MKLKPMRNNYLLLLVTVLFTISSFAQSGKVAGRVLNEKNEPLSGISIKITGHAGGATTDIEGRYILTLAEGKKYQLEFSGIGYAEKLVSDVEVTKGQMFNL